MDEGEPIPPEILERMQRFKEDAGMMSANDVVQRHLTQGDCFALDNSQHLNLKTEVARNFGIHPNEVVIVGSAKLGFSIAPEKRFRIFNDSSDIDIALASEHLFDEIWQEAFDYSVSAGSTWTNAPRFAKYLFRGWLRPDMLPADADFHRSAEWFEFFRQLSGSGRYGPYQIRAGLYRTWYFLERYQSVTVEQCQLELASHLENDLLD